MVKSVMAEDSMAESRLVWIDLEMTGLTPMKIRLSKLQRL